MRVQRVKTNVSLFALFVLFASVALSSGILRNLQHGFAQNLSGVTARDFYVPSGSDPWGTTFDSSGNVWVALPGYDPSPTCAQGTAPGKIEEFNPTTTSWTNTYTLPSGYGQPLFLVVDQQGRLWFPMPMSNSIGMFDPGKKTFQQWVVPTAASGPWGVAIDSLGKVWFTEHYTNQIGYFDSQYVYL